MYKLFKNAKSMKFNVLENFYSNTAISFIFFHTEPFIRYQTIVTAVTSAGQGGENTITFYTQEGG